MAGGDHNQTFWDHLDVFRSVIIRCIVAWMAGGVVCFCFRDWLFDILFAPSRPDFITYRWLREIAAATGWSSLTPPEFTPAFINTDLTGQFMAHMQVALWAGLVLVSPYVIVCLYGFIAPALYDNEKRWIIRAVGIGTALFLVGVLINYFIIFPFSFQFLFTYQVQEDIVNQIALSSFISTELMLSLMIGIVFELPIVGWALARMDIINAAMMRAYRRYALVAILIVAAIITPSGDAFTLMLVALPIYALYECTIIVVRSQTT